MCRRMGFQVQKTAFIVILASRRLPLLHAGGLQVTTRQLYERRGKAIVDSWQELMYMLISPIDPAQRYPSIFARIDPLISRPARCCCARVLLDGGPLHQWWAWTTMVLCMKRLSWSQLLPKKMSACSHRLD